MLFMPSSATDGVVTWMSSGCIQLQTMSICKYVLFLFHTLVKGNVFLHPDFYALLYMSLKIKICVKWCTFYFMYNIKKTLILKDSPIFQILFVFGGFFVLWQELCSKVFYVLFSNESKSTSSFCLCRSSIIKVMVGGNWTYSDSHLRESQIRNR